MPKPGVERPRVVVLDVEIEKPLNPEDPRRGWAAAKSGRLGMSCAVVWDNATGRPHLYDASTIGALVAHLKAADLIVGWNIKDFDIPLIEAISDETITVPQYDILHEVWSALNTRFLKGYKLGDVAGRTLGLEKSGAGVGAPTLVKEGRWAELFDYCLNDVFLTKELFNHILSFGYIIGTDGGKLLLVLPLEKELV